MSGIVRAAYSVPIPGSRGSSDLMGLFPTRQAVSLIAVWEILRELLEKGRREGWVRIQTYGCLANG